MKLKLLCLGFLFLFSCSAAVQEQKPAEVKKEKTPEEAYKERIRQDFEEFLRRAKNGQT